MQHWTAQQLQQHLAVTDHPPLLLDVREPWEFELCRIEGSVNQPLGQLPDTINSLDPEREIVVICHHGIRSLRAGDLMEQAGFKHLINLEGGIDAWSRAVDPNVPTY